MPISESDLIFFYSKGPDGTNKIGSAASLGGEITDNQITTTKLFDNIIKDQIQTGLVDYRCIYLKNNNTAESFSNLKLSITEYFPSTIQFGFEGVSLITLTGSITNATGDGNVVTYTYQTTGSPFVSEQDVVVFNMLPSSYNFSGTILSATSEPLEINGGFKTYQFSVSKETADSYISGGFGSQQAIITSQNNNPLNKTTTPTIDQLVPPTGISFLDSTRTYLISEFTAQSYIGIWIKRTIDSNTIPKDNDGFAINISAEGNTITVTPTPDITPIASTPTPTPTVTPPGFTFPPTPTPTFTSTPTPTPTVTPPGFTFPPTPTPTFTSTPTPTPTVTPPGFTFPPTPTPTNTSLSEIILVGRGIGNVDSYGPYTWNALSGVKLTFNNITFTDSGDFLPDIISFFIRITSTGEYVQVGTLNAIAGVRKARFTIETTCTTIGGTCCGAQENIILGAKPFTIAFPTISNNVRLTWGSTGC